MTLTREAPPHRITVGQLRQNPTKMLSDVQEGETYTITNHGRAVADVVPHEDDAWVQAERALGFLAAPGDTTWSAELRDERSAQDLRDPWE